MKLRLLIIASFSVLFFSGCSKKDSNPVEQAPKTLLTGTVQDAQTLPLGGVAVYTEPATQTATTDQNGKFIIDAIADGSYKVHAEKSGYLSEVKTNIGVKDTTVVQFMLRKFVNISGKVIDDTTGAGIEAVKISIPSIGFETVTASDGSFSISNIPEGFNLVYLSKTGYAYLRYDLNVSRTESAGYVIGVSKLHPISMIYVEGGSFMMGDTFGDGNFPEKPAHNVTLSNFYISAYEVTQKEWIETIGYNPAKFWTEENPVESVSWNDAYQFCNSRSLLEGLQPCYTITGSAVSCDFSANGYRLPTEAEWEYAARGGKNSGNTKYSGSSDPKEVAWFYNNSGNTTHPVGTKKANELGILDMSGNVWEFCWDFYGENYYSQSPSLNPTGPAEGQFRVLRGGAWTDDMVFNKVYYRNYYGQRDRGTNTGVRLVRKAD